MNIQVSQQVAFVYDSYDMDHVISFVIRVDFYSLLSGLQALLTCNISSNKASSCLCLPDVSTIIISKFSSLNFLKIEMRFSESN